MNTFDLDTAVRQRRYVRATTAESDLAAFREWVGQPEARKPATVQPQPGKPSYWHSLAIAVAVSAVAGFTLIYGVTAALSCDAPAMQLVAVDSSGDSYVLDSGMSPDDCARYLPRVDIVDVGDGRYLDASDMALSCELDMGN